MIAVILALALLTNVLIARLRRLPIGRASTTSAKAPRALPYRR